MHAVAHMVVIAADRAARVVAWLANRPRRGLPGLLRRVLGLRLVRRLRLKRVVGRLARRRRRKCAASKLRLGCRRGGLKTGCGGRRRLLRVRAAHWRVRIVVVSRVLAANRRLQVRVAGCALAAKRLADVRLGGSLRRHSHVRARLASAAVTAAGWAQSPDFLGLGNAGSPRRGDARAGRRRGSGHVRPNAFAGRVLRHRNHASGNGAPRGRRRNGCAWTRRRTGGGRTVGFSSHGERQRQLRRWFSE